MTETPTVHEAWSAVMADVQAVRKGDKNTQQGYNFRGIDAVVNAVGPALRAHRVHVTPIHVTPSWRDVHTSTGKASRECTVTVTYRVTGPKGDSFDGMSVGESMDFGDKGAPKAMSVAYRTFLLQALTIPTDDPDPDASSYERGVAPQRNWVADIQQCRTVDELRLLWPQLPPDMHPAAMAWKETLEAKENGQ